jgi:uncharacterized protein (TIGR02569 family)
LGHWNDTITALRAFHRALSEVHRPDLFDRRDNVYALADRTAWQEVPMTGVGTLGAGAQRLLRSLRPVNTPAQLIQGDPSEGNFLFDAGRAPAIIDVAPYWRPSEYSVALFVADAIAWSKAPLDLLETVRSVEEMDQFLARAILFRLMVAKLLGAGDDETFARHSNAYTPVIEAVGRWVSKSS